MLKNKVSVVTGGSRGIGAAIVRKLASMGSDIAIVDVGNKESAEQICAEIAEKYGVKAMLYFCDISDYNAVKDTVNQIKFDFGTVNILVNNAGVTRDGLLAMMSEENFDKVLDTNLKGTFNMIRHCSGIFIRNKEGCIVNISSVSGVMGNAGQANYAASKAGVIGLTKSVAKELASRGVRCNAVAPGFIQTNMTENFDSSEISKAIPLGRMGQPEDVADAVAYLVTAKYVTGDIIRVDGGIAM